MNFLLRTANSIVPDPQTTPELHNDMQSIPKPATTLEGLIAEDPFSMSSSSEDGERENDGVASSNSVGSTTKNRAPIGGHSDVSEDEGWIIIPHNELPENWSDAPDIQSFHALDRSFVFPGEQLHILACLSASKWDTDIITPFRVAAVMRKNGSPAKSTKMQMVNVGAESSPTNGIMNMDNEHHDTASKNIEESGETVSTAEMIVTKQDISATESLLRMEDHKQQTQILLEKLKNSHFFVRIAESDGQLWSKRTAAALNDGGARKTLRRDNLLSAFMDRGNFDGNTSGGMARNTVRCCFLQSGDMVVLLQVNVGIDNLNDPILEILQFEKFQTSKFDFGNHVDQATTNEDPYEELLRWLLPLDRALPPPGRPISPPLGSSSGAGSTSHRSMLSASSGSQLFSFGHFRSYSMPTLPQVSVPASSPVPPSNTKPSFGLEDFDHFTPEKMVESQDVGIEGLLSFRGVSLEPERFSAHCGLEGIYTPGRRWRKKLEIVQPIEINSFAADCNTEDLLCVQIKNVSPAHMPDIIIYLDTINVVFEEAPKGGLSMSLPISCIEAGNDHSLPNLALRRGEEHSFILKPAISMARDHKGYGERNSLQTHSGATASNMHMISMAAADARRIPSITDQYAVLVSCRCNYTESKLFFKKSTSWRPRIMRDLMISVASEISEQTFGQHGRVPQLPVQVLTLQASNLTSEDLTLTVLAPASFTSPPSVVSLNSAPTTPMGPFAGFPEFMGRVGEDRRGSNMQRLSSMPVPDSQKESNGGGPRSISLSERTAPSSDAFPSTDLGCTHLWLQSTVPLGCVPAQSSATVKLELLPLTDGIITLDTLQVAVKEKGLTYIPEHSLKIHATSSVATGIV